MLLVRLAAALVRVLDRLFVVFFLLRRRRNLGQDRLHPHGQVVLGARRKLELLANLARVAVDARARHDKHVLLPIDLLTEFGANRAFNQNHFYARRLQRSLDKRTLVLARALDKRLANRLRVEHEQEARTQQNRAHLPRAEKRKSTAGAQQ